MALRYPLNQQTSGAPFVLFTAFKAKYTSGAQAIGIHGGESAAMYVPAGFAVTDVMRYESSSPGLAGGVAENLLNGNNDYSGQNVMDVAGQGVGAAVQAGVGGVATLLTGGGGGVLAATAAQGSAAAAQSIYSKRKQQAMNPNEFMLFKAPGVRAFQFTFNMVPSSSGESDEVIKIVKFFREKMYPTLAASSLVYNFPEVFSVIFKNIEGIPKIAESALTNATVTYNPNSMSYFKHGNRPVEIVLALSFQELMPLSAANIKDGF